MTDSRRFRWAATSARLALGVAIAAIMVIGVVVGVTASWPTLRHEPVRITAVPAPADSVVVCDGPVLAAGRVSEDASIVTVAAAQTTTAAVDGEDPVQTALSAPDVQDSTGPAVFTAKPIGRERALLGAAASASVSAPDLSGYTADACRPPLLESWLVGGSTSTGAADLLILANPGDVTATVQLTVYGADGPVIPPGGANLLVPAQTQRVLSLAGLALGESAPVVRVSATGAPVRASLQSSLVRTLVPGGVDVESAIATPENVQVIPGVRVTSIPGEAGASETPTIARLLAPAAAGSATVTVTAVGAATPAMDPIVVALRAGIPAEVELDGLQVGDYVVTVEAEMPILSALWQTDGFGGGSDFAWLTSAPALETDGVIAVPDGPDPILSLVNRGGVAQTVQLTAVGGGDSRQVSVPAHGSAGVAVAPGSVWRVGAGENLHAAVSFAGPAGLAGFAAWPDDTAAPPVVVYP